MHVTTEMYVCSQTAEVHAQFSCMCGKVTAFAYTSCRICALAQACSMMNMNFRVTCLTLLSFKRYCKVITVTGKIYFPQKFLTVDVTVAVLCIWQHLTCRQCEQHFSPICSSYYQGLDSGGECGVPHERRFPMPRPSLDEAW